MFRQKVSPNWPKNNQDDEIKFKIAYFRKLWKYWKAFCKYSAILMNGAPRSLKKKQFEPYDALHDRNIDVSYCNKKMEKEISVVHHKIERSMENIKN